MIHRSTALAELREKDRNRQRRRRDRMKKLGIPQTHQCDNAIAEAVSFSLAMVLVGEGAVRKEPTVEQISFRLVFTTAHDILVKRWRFDKVHAAAALKSRLSMRQEHNNPYWTPHLPACEPVAWTDMSASKTARTPVTPSGRVHDHG